MMKLFQAFGFAWDGMAARLAENLDTQRATVEALHFERKILVYSHSVWTCASRREVIAAKSRKL